MRYGRLGTVSTDQQFWLDRIATLKEQIALYEAALTEFLTNGAVEEYRLDTGQSVVTVKRSDLTSITTMIDALLNQLDIACLRAGVARAGHQSRPGY